MKTCSLLIAIGTAALVYPSLAGVESATAASDLFCLTSALAGLGLLTLRSEPSAETDPAPSRRRRSRSVLPSLNPSSELIA